MEEADGGSGGERGDPRPREDEESESPSHHPNPAEVLIQRLLDVMYDDAHYEPADDGSFGRRFNQYRVIDDVVSRLNETHPWVDFDTPDVRWKLDTVLCFIFYHVCPFRNVHMLGSPHRDDETPTPEAPGDWMSLLTDDDAPECSDRIFAALKAIYPPHVAIAELAGRDIQSELGHLFGRELQDALQFPFHDCRDSIFRRITMLAFSNGNLGRLATCMDGGPLSFERIVREEIDRDCLSDAFGPWLEAGGFRSISRDIYAQAVANVAAEECFECHPSGDILRDGGTTFSWNPERDIPISRVLAEFWKIAKLDAFDSAFQSGDESHWNRVFPSRYGTYTPDVLVKAAGRQ